MTRDTTPMVPSRTATAQQVKSVQSLFRRDPLCLRIVQYLARHNDAADTARGIAEWWIGRDVAETEAALARLAEHGVVERFVVQNGTCIYTYTKNDLLRSTVTRCLSKAT